MSSIAKLLPSCRFVPLAAAVALSSSGTALGATITVDNATAANVAGGCTIVDAVASMNQAKAVAGSSCVNTGAPFGTADTIEFASNFNIVFAAPAGTPHSALMVTKPMTIKGGVDHDGKPTVTITRDSNAGTQFRLIESGANLVLSGLRISGGDVAGDGGAVFLSDYRTLDVVSSVISGNSASVRGGAIYASSGTLVTLNNATISDNTAPAYGGGIYSDAVDMTNSTVSNNSSSQGGGILTVTSFVATGSTISGNLATAVGGGIYSFGSAALTDATISGNYAAYSGGGMSADHAQINFCTITDNSVGAGGLGAGVYLRGSGNSATSSLMFGNSSGNDVDGPSQVTIALAGNHDLIGTHGFDLSVPNDTRTCNPSLGALWDNGGTTQTHAIFDGSCAVDEGSATTTIMNDQRGSLRDVGAATDIGAYEVQNAPFDGIFAGQFE